MLSYFIVGVLTHITVYLAGYTKGRQLTKQEVRDINNAKVALSTIDLYREFPTSDYVEELKSQ